MSIRIQILILAFVLSLLGFIFELLRRKKMSEALTLWWLSIIVLIIFLTLNQSLLDKIRDFLGVGLPLSVLLLFSLCFVLIMLIYFSMKIRPSYGNKIQFFGNLLVKFCLGRIMVKSVNL